MNRPSEPAQPPASPQALQEWAQFPCVVVHRLADATAALSCNSGVTLLSAQAAAGFAGCAWWQAMVRQARTAHPATPSIDILDCGDAPGLAMAALRIGQRHLILHPCPGFDRVAAAAQALGALVLPARPPALDLAERGAISRLPAWLSPAGITKHDIARP